MDGYRRQVREQYARLDSEELVERVKDGTLTDEAQRLAEAELASRGISLLQLPPSIVEELTVKQQAKNTRAWIRLWARFFDIYLIVRLLVLAIVFIPGLNKLPGSIIALVLIFSWIFVEPLVLSLTGTTPGKWLLSTNVAQSSGQPISYAKALLRSVNVWWRGLGIGIPLVAIITMALAHRRLKESGTTSWDQDGDFVVTHKPIVAVRAFIAAAIVAGSYFAFDAVP